MKKAVLLFNLGGPKTLQDVKPFLINLFSDPEIIQLPFASLLQKPFAHFIANLRQNVSKGYYSAMGGGSPLLQITNDQADKLKKELEQSYPGIKVYVGMQCSEPSIEKAWLEIKKDGIEELVVLPLYPQYSFSTTKSGYHHLMACQKKLAHPVKMLPIIEWYDNPDYIRAFAQLIQKEISQLPFQYKNKFHVIFSAHSLPVKMIQRGDPYENQTHKTARLIVNELGGVESWHVSYQSQAGWMRWLEPSTVSVLEGLSKTKGYAYLIVPISFVSDHVETLYEIDVLFKKEARQLGIECFKRVPSLNAEPDFISALKNMVVSRLEATQ